MITHIFEMIRSVNLLFLFFFLISLSSAEISLNSTLYASNPSQTWFSSNKTFSLGFVPISSSFLAAITYNGGSVVVWSIRTPVDSSGSLRLLPTGDLILAHGNGSTVWSSNTSSMGVTSASLDDTGNLILGNASSTVWSSFDYPTDTIVPSQKFPAGKELTNGNYSFTLSNLGNLTLLWKGSGSITYWNQGLNSSVNATLTSPILNLQPIGILSISDPSLSDDAVLYYSSDYAEGSDILRFLRLDSDGNLRIYSSSRGSGTTDVRWAAVLDQCRVFGYCGDLGICSYNNSNPICGCPSQNFELIDPSDSRKGCKRKMEMANCPGSATMLQLDHALFLTYPPELSSEVFFVGISACRLNCLVSSSCIASTSLSDGTGLCYLKTPEFISGYENPSLPSTSYVKVCGPVVPNPSSLEGAQGKGSSLYAWVVAVVVLGTLLCLILVEGGLWYWCLRKSPRFGGFSSRYALLEYASGAPVQFTYKELQRSTKGFKEKLGAGGFGAVYRGVLANRTIVAVKQLEGIEQGERQFRMEVATISSTHHLNLVRLIGFCSEGRHRLLVYEFMKNGSLDNFIFSSEDVLGKFLNWENRFNIVLGTARGITYLHEECRDCIIHCDIKPENILLDENFNAKVSDFGLAKLINPKDQRYRTLKSVRGTRGYLAPEWLANLLITSKSDVYSYGMVLLEIVSGKRNFDVSSETNQKKFSVWAYEEFDKGNIEAVMDKRLREQPDVDMAQVVRALQVSFWCIQEQPSHRPTMGKVVQMLEGIAEIGKPPAPRALTTEGFVGGNNINISSSVSALSTFAASAPAPSSVSSLQTAEVSPLTSSGRIKNPENATASLLG
ncbi:hypothetical protein SAY86_013820 [Trapa natans]|uniref:Receptor-like serine/threonine-protein kinase n=1 Tax=Trapa natans TaxID=22666 RepID=A0AAN7KY03_TRANT|nr:hypothetical protein SAY86_013820 [Trapa natans]